MLTVRRWSAASKDTGAEASVIYVPAPFCKDPSPGSNFIDILKLLQNDVQIEAIIAGGKGTTAEKFAALEAAGITTVKSLADIGNGIKKATGWN